MLRHHHVLVLLRQLLEGNQLRAEVLAPQPVPPCLQLALRERLETKKRREIKKARPFKCETIEIKENDRLRREGAAGTAGELGRVGQSWAKRATYVGIH